MATDRRSRRGADPAVRRGRRPANLYRSVMQEITPDVLAAAARTEGLNDEVAVVRVLLRRHLAEHPENLELVLKGMHLLVRMVTAQHGLSSADAAQLNERAEELARHFAAAVFGEEVADG